MSEPATTSSLKDPSISSSTINQQVPAETKSSTGQAPFFTGACFCGAITFTLSSLPIKFYLCHCPDCRRMTGTSFAHNIAFPCSSLKVSASHSDGQSADNSAANPNTNGALSTFGDLESGRRQFCRICGTGLFLFGKVRPGEECDQVIVQAGAIDGSNQDERLRPVEEGFCKRREDWMPDMKGTKVFQEW